MMKINSYLLCAVLLSCGQTSWADQTAPSVIAGKNYAGVNIRALTPAQGPAGMPLTIQLEYEARPSAGHLAVTYTTEGALTLTSAKSVDLTVGPTGTVRDTLIVRAPTDGVYFANVFAQLNGRNQVVSIPVQVGNAVVKLKPLAKVKSPNAAATVIEMRGTETAR